METLQTDDTHPGWEQGWIVLRVKRELPGDFVSIHAHAEHAQAEAHRLGAGHQVFHGRRHVATDEVVID